MHDIEPYFNWRNLYIASNDRRSPFFDRQYSEFEFTNTIYNHYIHPQWDHFGSATLYLKIIYVDYSNRYCIIEMIGEWNDCIYNDIMFLKREVVDALTECGINKFILLGENVLNFHASENDYYQEWFEDIEDGWIAFVNFRQHVIQEVEQAHIDYYVAIGGTLNNILWKNLSPVQLYNKVMGCIIKRFPV
jgi:hypothetical protein